MLIMQYLKTLLHTSTFQRWLIVLTWLALPGLVQAGSLLSSLEAGFTLTPGVSYLHRSQPLPEGLTYRSGWNVSGGFSISFPISQAWKVTSGIQIINLRYVYRLSPKYIREHLILQEDDTHFRIHPVYLSIPLLVQRTIVSRRDHEWALIIGTRFYQRLRIFDPPDNLQELILPYKLAVDTGPRYHQRLINLVGGLGYIRDILSHWRLQVSFLAEYGMRTFISDARGLIFGNFANTRVVSILPQVQVRYRF